MLEVILAELKKWVEGDLQGGHVIFLHGLGGNLDKTWRAKGGGFWPIWLAEDVPGLSVWGVGYDAAVTKWRGASMPLPDRAENILARLRVEAALNEGPITLVGHSLGGLVAIQLLRLAERDANAKSSSASFLQRVRKVAFLGTPHRGASLADLLRWLGPFARHSSSTADLVRNDANLRELNLWYRQYCRDHGIQNLVLTEGWSILKNIPLLVDLSFVVRPDSADPGVFEAPIPVDANHISIAKPQDRNAEVYRHVLHFVTTKNSASHAMAELTDVMQRQVERLEGIERQMAAFREAKIGAVEIGSTPKLHPGNARIVDAEIRDRLELIIRKRLYSRFDLPTEARLLGEALAQGELGAASDSVRAEALAWCARFLSSKDTKAARRYFELATMLGSGETLTIAKAFLTGLSDNDLAGAMALLSPFDTGQRLSAAFVIRSNVNGFDSAQQWLEATGHTFLDLESDAKTYVLQNLLVKGAWEAAYDFSESLDPADYDTSPLLGMLSADACVALTCPEEARPLVVRQIPFEARAFPLAAQPLDLERRRKAHGLYQQTHARLKKIGMSEVAAHAADKALWLALRDPDSETAAREELIVSMQDRDMALRRVPLALQFGLDIDTRAVEREIERHTAISGNGPSAEAAVARLALAFTQKTPAAVAGYIDRYRTELESVLNVPGIAVIEIQMLAEAGLTSKAESRLRAVEASDVGELELLRLRRIVAEASGADPVEMRLETYRRTGSLSDLRNLVTVLKERKDWGQLAVRGRELFEGTRDPSDLEYYAHGLYETGSVEALVSLLHEYSDLVKRSAFLSQLQCFALLEVGRYADARREMNRVRVRADDENLRGLVVSVAIGSGDWESLQGFIEEEWTHRNLRRPHELLRAAQLAHRIASPRAKDLVMYTAEKAQDDPHILVGCYTVATEAGMEGSHEVASWLQAAAELSGDDGPVQSVSLDDLIARKPDWDRREAEVFSKLMEGQMPIFVAGHLLNRSQLSLSLLPALVNLGEPDVRKRAIVHAFSGARRTHVPEADTVAMDVSALVIAGFLGIAEKIFEAYSEIYVSPRLMGWLFEERFKISFHQPSRVRAAHNLQRLLAERKVQVHVPTRTAPTSLVSEIGDDLAELVAAAATQDKPEQNHIVVHSFPVYKAGTLMQEEVDLGVRENVMTSCGALVHYIFEKGLMPPSEFERCRAYLSIHEKPWPNQRTITAGTVLYLDESSLASLEHLGLLTLLVRAGFSVRLGSSVVEQADALIAYDSHAFEVIAILERLRVLLRDGIATGKVGMVNSRDDATESLRVHPTLDVFKAAKRAEAIVIDDRYINQHPKVSVEGVDRPILTTLDVLEGLRAKGLLDDTRTEEARTLLRRATMMMVPVDAQEIHTYLGRAVVREEGLQESGELRAIREHVQRLQMADMLQLPSERVWLETLRESCLWNMKSLWTSSVPSEEIYEKAEWLLYFVENHDWAHRLPNASLEAIELLQRQCVLDLILLMHQEEEPLRQRYWAWLEARVLVPLREEQPDMFRSMMAHITDTVERLATDPVQENVE